jgi:DNA repair protein RadD
MDGDRDEILKAHQQGKIWGVSNKDILTTGWNNPLVTLMMNLRLTRSPGLWTQMVGRMTRPIWLRNPDGSMKYDITTREGRWASIHESGKVTSRVLDFCGNTERLGPINYPNIPKKRGQGGGESPVRTCDAENTYDHYTEEHNQPHCSPGTIHHTSVKVCPHCGYEWPKQKASFNVSHAELVSATNPLGLPPVKKVEKEYEVLSVHELVCTHHSGKSGKKDTMKVTYRCGTRTFNKWVCIEHDQGSWARKNAEEWWVDHSGEAPIPNEVEEAVDRSGELSKPKFIRVWTNTKYPEIVGFDFIGHKFEPVDLSDLSKPRELHEPEPDPMEKMRDEAYASRAYSTDGAFNDYYDEEIPF